MTDTKIYARCSNPKVDYLTDGKLYEVKEEHTSGHFKIEMDNGCYLSALWKGYSEPTWERIEQTDPPQWALDKAAKAARAASWNDYCISWSEMSGQRQLALEYAATLAKYETEPVDPVLVKAREIVAKHWPHIADSYLSGRYDGSTTIEAITEALRLPAMGAGQ